MKKILLASLILLLSTGCIKENVKEESKIIKNDGMLSYTIDGEKTDIKPSKEDGYIVNKIICDNGSDMMWDNDNWEVELTKVNSKDRCKVDFTKDITKEGYRVTVTSNMTSSLDSLSKATTLNGTIIIYSTSKIESVTGCNGVIEDNKVIISNIKTNQLCNVIIEDKTLVTIIKKEYPPIASERPDFSDMYIGNPGLYTGEDNQGTTYYFSGDGTNMNNWVSFAGSKWRIIRINGNGSMRLLYAGSGDEDGFIGNNIKYNSNYNHPSYVGWKYTVGGNLTTDRKNENKSNVFTTVENWYNNLTSIDKNYIDEETIYCNDRNIGSGEYKSTNTAFFYASYQRFINTKSAPTFKCNELDSFNRFGLMTADEVVAAGGLYGKIPRNSYYYLNANGGSSTGNNWWWTMTPYRWDGAYAYVFFVRGFDIPAYLDYVAVSNGIHGSGVVRPVISLKKEVQVIGGDGSGNNPYTVKMPD